MKRLSIEAVQKSRVFPYQHAILYDDSKFIIIEKSRRIGGTWILSIKAVKYALKTGYNVWFSSSDAKTGLEFIRYVHAFVKLLNAKLGQNYIDTSLFTTQSVTLPQGNTITAISSDPKAILGKDGMVILDEFAHHEDAETIYNNAVPCVTQKGCLIICSSHNGPATLFARLCKEPLYSHHKVTIVDAVNQGYAIKFKGQHSKLLPDVEACNNFFIEQLKRQSLNEDAFKQNYMCEPLSATNLITSEEFDRLTPANLPAEVDWTVPEQLNPQQTYNDIYIGIDPALTKDYSVLWAVEEYVNQQATSDWDRYDYKTVALRMLKQLSIPSQYQIYRQIVGHPNVQMVCIDVGTVGHVLSDSLLDEFGDAKIVPVSFNNNTKARLAERMKGLVAYKRISMPDHPQVRDDFLSIRRDVTQKGLTSYNGSTKDSHCDSFWAAALAAEAASIAHNNGGMQVVGMK